MTSLDFSHTVAQLSRRLPGALAILRNHGIDHHYAANLTLTEICAMHGLDPGDLLHELEESQRDGRFLSPPILEEYGLAELIGYIISTHHLYLQKELPRLEDLLGEAVRLDGTAFPGLMEVLDWFMDFKLSLEWHMKEEEKNLFPFILGRVSKPSPDDRMEELESIISVFQAEEGRIQSDLDMLRKKSGDYKTAPGASHATRELFHDLQHMEKEIRRHLHDENAILFSKVTGAAKEGGPKTGSRKNP